MLSTFSFRSAILWGPKVNERSQGVGSLSSGYGKVISVLHFVLLQFHIQSPAPRFCSTPGTSIVVPVFSPLLCGGTGCSRSCHSLHSA